MDEKNGLICPGCGMFNASSSKFCIKCGTNLPKQGDESNNAVVSEDINQSVDIQNNNDAVQTASPQEMLANPPQDIQTTTVQQEETHQPSPQENIVNMANNLLELNNSDGKFNPFKYIVGVLLRPYDRYVSEEKNLSDIKNLSILGGIIIGILTIVRLITTMFSYVRVKSILSNDVTWAWDNLIEVPYFKTIFVSLFVYAGIVLALAGVYYLGGMLVKKDTKFIKLLGISLTAFIPYAAGMAVLYPILSLIYIPLGLIAVMIGLIYSILVLLELINDTMGFEIRSIRIYFHLACLSIIMTFAVFIAYKIIIASLLGL